MRKFIKGNIIKDGYGYICIISDARQDGCDWVSFGASNSSGFTKFETVTEDRTCWDACGNHCNDEECKTCKGTGTYKYDRLGLDKATLLGTSVKDYIIDSLTKNFNF